VAEWFADGQASLEELQSAGAAARAAATRLAADLGTGGSYRLAAESAASTTASTWRMHVLTFYSVSEARVEGAKRAERALQCQLCRCVLGNLARVADEDRKLPAGGLDLTRLAILADALEEAGCAEASILSHLRGPGPHVRGCFA